MESKNYALLGVISFLLILFLLSLNLDQSARHFWLSEGGVVESVSAVGYFVCVALLLYWGGWQYFKKCHYFFIILILFGLRELDFDKRFTTLGIFKSKFYASSDISVVEKVIGLLVIALFIYCIIAMVKNHLKGLIIAIKDFSPPHLSLFFAIGFVFMAKLLDGVARKLSGFGITVSESFSTHAEAFEEIAELGIPIFIFMAAYQFFSQHKQVSRDDDIIDL